MHLIAVVSQEPSRISLSMQPTAPANSGESLSASRDRQSAVSDHPLGLNLSSFNGYDILSYLFAILDLIGANHRGFEIRFRTSTRC